MYTRNELQTIDDVKKAIKKRVSRRVIIETFCGVHDDCLSLSDAFDFAARQYAKPGTELYKAWYTQDYRKFIPSEYIPRFLDFKKYPLNYQ